MDRTCVVYRPNFYVTVDVWRVTVTFFVHMQCVWIGLCISWLLDHENIQYHRHRHSVLEHRTFELSPKTACDHWRLYHTQFLPESLTHGMLAKVLRRLKTHPKLIKIQHQTQIKDRVQGCTLSSWCFWEQLTDFSFMDSRIRKIGTLRTVIMNNPEHTVHQQLEQMSSTSEQLCIMCFSS